nr:intercellular adhesion molecule 5 isoform X2 [Syngnathus scovelli]
MALQMLVAVLLWAALYVCPLAHSYFNFAATISKPCYENITLVWDELWSETHRGRDVKKLYTVANGTLNEWGAKEECYFSREACYVLPPITFYNTPVNVWVYVKPDSAAMLEDRFHTLICGITMLRRMQYLTIRWLEGGRIINIRNSSVTQWKISFPLVIRMKRESTYTCQAEYMLDEKVTQREASIKLTSESPDSSPVPDSRPVLVPVIIICVLTLFAVLALIFICISRKRRGLHSFTVQSDNIGLEQNRLAT